MANSVGQLTAHPGSLTNDLGVANILESSTHLNRFGLREMPYLFFRSGTLTRVCLLDILPQDKTTNLHAYRRQPSDRISSMVVNKGVKKMHTSEEEIERGEGH